MTHAQRYNFWLRCWEHLNRVRWAIRENEPGIAYIAARQLCRAANC
jgi:hypothetical protein